MTSAPPDIRIASEADTATIAEFNQAMAWETESKRLDPSVILEGAKALLRDPHRGRYYLAQIDGEIVGQLMLTFEWSDWRNGQFWWIQSVFVRREYRAMGVYRALHEHVERAARNTPGVCGLRLYVDRDNHTAQQVYRRLGMVRTNYDLYETDWSLRAT